MVKYEEEENKRQQIFHIINEKKILLILNDIEDILIRSEAKFVEEIRLI